MSSSNQSVWAHRASKLLGLPGQSALIPIILLGAHYVRGAEADDPGNTYTYALILCLVGLVTFVTSRCRAAAPGLAVAAIGFAVWVALGFTGNWHRAQTEIITLIAAGFVFLTGTTAARTTETMSTAWRALIWSWLFFAILALIGHITNYTGDPMQSGAYDATRLRAGFVSPNTTATLLSIAALICLGKLLYAVNHASSDVKSRQEFVDYIFRASLTTIIVLALTLSCLLLTASRFVTILCVLAMVYLIESEYRTYRGRRSRLTGVKRLIRTLLYVVLVIAAVSAFFLDLLADRTIEATSELPTKLDLFGLYWSAWLEKPWFGHGLGSFNRVNDALMTLENVGTTGSLGAAHNIVLQWLIQQGVVGSLLMFGLVAALHIPVIRAIRKSTRRSKTFLRVSLCISGLVILHGMLDYALEIPSVMWTYAFVLGLAHGRGSTLLGIKLDADRAKEKTEPANKELAVA